jgi:hypothetical protein
LFLGSCNGSADGSDTRAWENAFNSAELLADTPWVGTDVPVFSSSCNSGLHALYAAKEMLLAGEADEAVVVACDILSHSNQNNFESLRVLSAADVSPWQQRGDGFILGEAAVVLRIGKAESDDECAPLHGPILTSDLLQVDGLRKLITELSTTKPTLLIGQGTGPAPNDEEELAIFDSVIDSQVPLTTPLVHFGHTLGASGLLSIALAAIANRNGHALPTLQMRDANTTSGRTLVNGSSVAGNVDKILIASRALNGSCAAAIIGKTDGVPAEKDLAWQTRAALPALMHPTLRKISRQALDQRPPAPPDLLLVRLEVPLTPPPEAVIGNRLLPSAVLEMTPGFISQLIARSWGFTGTSLCTVGNAQKNGSMWDLKARLATTGRRVFRVDVNGNGDEREIEWDS